MSSSLVLILWPSSVLFTGVLSFRIGVWWKGIHLHGRHEFVPRRHGDGRDSYLEAEEYREDDVDDDGSWLSRRPASAPEGPMGDEGDELDADDRLGDASDTDTTDSGALDVGEGMEAATGPMERLPAEAERGRWRGRDDDTEVLPRLQDVRPPTRATPIRRPPWVGRGGGIGELPGDDAGYQDGQ